jgi:polyferredoxin
MIDPATLAYDHDEESLGFPEPARKAERNGTAGERAAAAVTALGLLVLAAGVLGVPGTGGWAGFLGGFGVTAAGAAVWFRFHWRATPTGVRHDGIMFRGIQNRSAAAWGLGVLLTGFYVVLYWFPQHLERLVRVADPLARVLTGADADRWFVYGLLYTLAILVFGARMLMKYRHSRYHLVRTGSVMSFQLVFAFLIPYLLKGLNRPDFYFSYFWPLKPDYLFPSTIATFRDHAGAFGQFLVFWSVVVSLVAVPVLTYFLGKRWYCSWVCGCGGLAETLGDPFRQLSSKSTRAWIVERWLIHSVLVAIVVVTAALWLHEITGGRFLGSLPFAWKQWYGFFIGAIFSGVIGVGFYPIMGSRVWCRFGCPQAAILGLFQRFFSRFRITVNGGQCMSCGNCSTYCEMGIDVRAYAQQGANVVRASCVGCGVCASVCPRGVLKLENGKDHQGRYPGSERPLGALREALRDPGRPRLP